MNDSVGLEKFLKSIKFDLPDGYEKSWEHIFNDNNSIKRCSNLYLLLEQVIELVDSLCFDQVIEEIKKF